MKIRKAFTLVEVMIVVVIVGVLAAVAMPRIFGANEPARAADGLNALGILRSAQSTYCLDHDCTGNKYPTDCNVLEVTVNPNPNNFDNVVCKKNGDMSVRRITKTYTITVDRDGAYTCTNHRGTLCTTISKVMPK